MNEPDQLQRVKARTRRRLGFSLVVLVLYFSFVLNWTRWGEPLTQPLGDSQITGSLVMFVALIVVFITLEALFIALYRREQSRDE